MPETAAGRALLDDAEREWPEDFRLSGDAIDAIEAEARALGRAEALAPERLAKALADALRASMSRPGYGYIDFTWHPGDDESELIGEANDLAPFLAGAIDNLETP